MFTLSLVAFGSGCGFLWGRGVKKIAQENLTDGRLTDVIVTHRVTGKRQLLLFSKPQYTYFLEGYIQGQITDYDDNPIAGVVVEALLTEGAAAQEESGRTEVQGTSPKAAPGLTGSASFDSAVSDTNGIYRLRFFIPIYEGHVNVRGTLRYNPGWDQERMNLGYSYEPQNKDSSFRIFYDQDSGFLLFGEGVRKSIVHPVSKTEAAQQLPGGARPKPTPAATLKAQEQDKAKKGPAKPAEGAGEEPAQTVGEDIFKNFPFGQ
ncbi:MAG: hypothetical protein A3G41_03570 [Elusimicrobia bacterium RIFCSPLOWO2_12_FULL_59_9]|nr:MAG: hypothetical protein A3G41_03570 [Elusimicrobia bacterium RIFCSPLOWO2_12_FULL_59_9]